MVRILGAGSLAARALVFMSARPFSPQAADKAQYAANTASAVNTLQGQWYDDVDGLWNSTGWWNSANLLTTLADFALDAASDAEKSELSSVFANTFTNAQKVAQTASKVVNAAGLVTSTYSKMPLTFNLTGRAEFNGFAGFINTFYDDEGWWALAWIRAFDVTGTAAYLAMAESIFADMQTGTQPAACGGGIWWSKDHTYKNAIANELYLSVAASLANRATDAKARAQYLQIAASQWAWFKASGMINSQGTINDGLAIQADGTCVNNNQTVWSYNQGVVLGGLVELHRAQAAAASNGTADASLIPAAAAIANAAIAKLSTAGILHESCEAGGGNCGGDGPTFKGVFLRNLHYLQQEPTLDAATAGAFKAYILQNANSIWNTDRVAGSNQLGLVWSGPPTAGGAPTAATHGSAMDCLVAAIAAAAA
ncbi:hypothetical protein SCUCBS95973_006898 [Sporothrix curviconia]|uniref:Glycosyl hydrolase n=1 Tax=Sporothrix curviconia TaxID=1260050 RepID=A0ABP0C8Z0_9PEZI